MSVAGTHALIARGCASCVGVIGALVLVGNVAVARVEPRAEQGELEPVGKYAELFLEHPKVSGNLLVGLRWMSPGGSFDPDRVGLSKAGGKGTGLVCVGVMSKDGRYTAENLYDLANSPAPAPLLQSKTEYGKELRGYRVDEIAVIIRAASSCDTADSKVVIPATVMPADGGQIASGRRELLAFVNADPERVGMSLIDSRGDVSASGSCVAAGAGVHIAYSTVCALTVPDKLASAGLKLRLSIKERFKTVPTDYRLLLP